VLLSRTYPPSPALAPYIRRHYVFEAELPADSEIVDGLLSENAFVRIIVRGDWTAEVGPVGWQGNGQILLFGANARPLKVRVRGPFTVVGFAIRPSGWASLFWEPARTYADTVVALSEAWGDIASQLWLDLSRADTDESKIAAIEGAITTQMGRIGVRHPDDIIAEFERIARVDPIVKVEDIAAQLHLSVRQLERRCLAACGLTPKMILRRSRFLDMAAAMRGFSSPSEEQLAKLRYFDQSHLNREFKRFANMTPGAFASASTPLFTAGLKLREEGKVLE
jgi:AraC-like DNA-binding protein